MSRLPITTFVGVTIIIWGGCEMCLGASQNFAGLGAARFFLGFAEGTVSPAFIIITSNWYRRREHAIRVAVWVSMSGISQIVGGVLMYLIGGAKMSVQNWRAMFLIAGGLTSLCGIAFLVLMPRDSTTAWFLNEREREVATKRLALDRATRDKKNFNKQQAKEALLQPITWLYFFMALCITLTTPILKVSLLIGNHFTLFYFSEQILIYSAAVLVLSDQRLRLLQVPNHACRSSWWRYQFYNCLARRSHPTHVPKYTYFYCYRAYTGSAHWLNSSTQPTSEKCMGHRCLYLALWLLISSFELCRITYGIQRQG